MGVPSQNIITRLVDLYRESLTNISKEVWLLSLVALINRSGSVVLPFLTLYLTQDLGWDKGRAAIVAACYGIGAILGSFLGGMLTERFGAFRVMFISLIGSGIAFFGFIHATDFYYLCFWSILTTTIADAYRPAVMTAVDHFSTDDNRTRGISLIRMAVNLGVAIGPAFAGIVIASIGYDFIFIVDGITCIVSGLFFYFIFSSFMKFKSEQETKEQNQQAFTDGVFLLFMLINILNLVGFFQIISAVPLFLKEIYLWDEAAIGGFFFFNGFVIFLLEMPIVHYLDKKKNPISAMMVGAFMIGVAHLCLLIDASFFIGIAAYSIIIAVGEIINFPFIASISLERAGKGNSGNYMGIVSVMFSITFLIAPLIGLNMIDAFDYEITWVAMAILSFLSVAGLFMIKGRITHKTPNEANQTI